jgi:hypothetical protein
MKNPPVALTILLLIFSGFAQSQAQEIILLKNYRPVSIYHTPQAKVTRAAFPSRTFTVTICAKRR